MSEINSNLQGIIHCSEVILTKDMEVVIFQQHMAVAEEEENIVFYI